MNVPRLHQKKKEGGRYRGVMKISLSEVEGSPPEKLQIKGERRTGAFYRKETGRGRGSLAKDFVKDRLLAAVFQEGGRWLSEEGGNRRVTGRKKKPFTKGVEKQQKLTGGSLNTPTKNRSK